MTQPLSRYPRRVQFGLALLTLGFLIHDSGGAETAAVPRESSVAVYASGNVSEEALISWRQYLKVKGQQASREEAIEDLVVIRVLAKRLPDSNAEIAAKVSRGLEQIKRTVARSRVRQAIRQEVQVTDAEIRQAMAASPDLYHQPSRWRLSNIFRRMESKADEAQWMIAKSEMESIRAQIVEGAPFEDLAKRSSDSQTRLRGGDLGFVSLDRLDPVVAEAVRVLEVGDLSPVIASKEGLTLLLCTAYLPARKTPVEEVRKRIDRQLRKQRFDENLAALEAKFNQPTQGISLSDNQNSSDSQEKESPLLGQSYVQEAERRGLLEQDSVRNEIAYRELELRAQISANHWTEQHLVIPQEEKLKKRYLDRQEPITSPEAWQVRAIVVPKKAELGRDYLDSLRRKGEELARQGGEWSKVISSLAPHASTRDFGWLTSDQLWTLGRNVDHGVRKLNVGDWSALIQQNSTLYLFELQAKREKRPLSFEEARPHLEAADLAAQRRRLGKILRAEIVAEQAIDFGIPMGDE